MYDHSRLANEKFVGISRVLSNLPCPGRTEVEKSWSVHPHGSLRRTEEEGDASGSDGGGLLAQAANSLGRRRAYKGIKHLLNTLTTSSSNRSSLQMTDDPLAFGQALEYITKYQNTLKSSKES